MSLGILIALILSSSLVTQGLLLPLKGWSLVHLPTGFGIVVSLLLLSWVLGD